MKPTNCPQESAVAKAVHTGRLDESLANHATECAICAEILQTATWMQVLACGSESNPRLPHASLVWWKARFSEEEVKTEKAQDFLELLEIISAVVVSVGLLGWVALNWFAVQKSILSILVGSESWLSVYFVATILLPGVAVVCLLAFALGYPLFADE